MTEGADRARSPTAVAELHARMQAAAALIEPVQRVYAVCHQSPDGDAIGSLLGLGWALKALGKEVTLACADAVPRNLTFLPGSQHIVTRPPLDEELIIVVDTGSLDHLGALYQEPAFQGKPLIVIDHHASNAGFADVNVVDPQVAATAELVYDWVQVLGVPIDARIATCLLTGIIADTRGFRTSSTTVRSVELTAALMKAGAKLPEILWRVFNERSFATLCLWGRVLNSTRRRGRLAWAVVTQAMLRECGASLQDLGDLVNMLVTRDTDVGILFKETGNHKVRVSVRSAKGVDVSPLAAYFGGGGHPQAAGFTVDGSLHAAEEQVLKVATQMLHLSDA